MDKSSYHTCYRMKNMRSYGNTQMAFCLNKKKQCMECTHTLETPNTCKCISQPLATAKTSVESIRCTEWLNNRVYGQADLSKNSQPCRRQQRGLLKHKKVNNNNLHS